MREGVGVDKLLWCLKGLDLLNGWYIGNRNIGSAWYEYKKVEEKKTDGINIEKEEDSYSKSILDDEPANSSSLRHSQFNDDLNYWDANTFKSNSDLSQESEIGISVSEIVLTMRVNRDVEGFLDHENGSNNPKGNHDFHKSIEEEKDNYQSINHHLKIGRNFDEKE
jgi:hypothetical protein